MPSEYVKPYSFKDPRRNVFAGMLSCLDEQLGHVISTFKSKGLYDNSVIVLTTDNGVGQILLMVRLPWHEGANTRLRGVPRRPKWNITWRKGSIIYSISTNLSVVHDLGGWSQRIFTDSLAFAQNFSVRILRPGTCSRLGANSVSPWRL